MLRIFFIVLAVVSIFFYGLTGEWYWMLGAITNGCNAYVFGPDGDDKDESAAA